MWGIEFNWDFLVGFLSITVIDLVLAGDNAVVIALAVRNLPPKEKTKGIILGALAAVLLRVTLTFFASQLLTLKYVKLFGGILITWIAVKLFVEGCPEDECKREAKSLGQAIWTIMVADIVMSTDNVLAVAGASKGSLFLLLFGLGLSIPFVVFTSGLLSRLMERFPWIIYIGAAILGKVAGDMIITDPVVHDFLHPGAPLEYGVMAVFAVGVIVAGKLWMRLRPGAPVESEEPRQ